jgi:hypothetical protein
MKSATFVVFRDTFDLHDSDLTKITFQENAEEMILHFNYLHWSIDDPEDDVEVEEDSKLEIRLCGVRKISVSPSCNVEEIKEISIHELTWKLNYLKIWTTAHEIDIEFDPDESSLFLRTKREIPV